MHVFVTGGAGFIGANLVEFHLARGDRVTAMDDLSTGIADNVAAFSHYDTYRFERGDILDWRGLAGAVASADRIYHMAAVVGMFRVLNQPVEVTRVNVVGTEMLANAAAMRGVRRMVFVSTSKVNGESTSGVPFTEGASPHPQDPYAVSKWEAEEALRSVAARTGLEIAIVRPPLVYGPGVHANFLRLMKWVERGIPLPLPDIRNRRSLIGVENLADFLVRCARHPAAANATFLVSDGEDLSTRDLITRLAKALGRSARFLPVPELVIRFAARLVGKEAAVDRLFGSLVIDSDTARQSLAWKPPLSLDAGLADTARWYLQSSRPMARPKPALCQ